MSISLQMITNNVNLMFSWMRCNVKNLLYLLIHVIGSPSPLYLGKLSLTNFGNTNFLRSELESEKSQFIGLIECVSWFINFAFPLVELLSYRFKESRFLIFAFPLAKLASGRSFVWLIPTILELKILISLNLFVRSNKAECNFRNYLVWF